ncbi:MAG: hypothetical protein HRT87_04925 [Legionellales bacterium]|nr:hypothetical protein [Legionellales bacterium]
MKSFNKLIFCTILSLFNISAGASYMASLSLRNETRQPIQARVEISTEYHNINQMVTIPAAQNGNDGLVVFRVCADIKTSPDEFTITPVRQINGEPFSTFFKNMMVNSLGKEYANTQLTMDLATVSENFFEDQHQATVRVGCRIFGRGIVFRQGTTPLLEYYSSFNASAEYNFN